MRVLADSLLRQAGQQLPCFSPRVLKCHASSTNTAHEAAERQAKQAEERRVRFHRLQQTPEERSSQDERLLNQAEVSLAEYCCKLPGDDADSERCWLAYDYFERCKEEAESGCEVDYSTGSRSGPDCAKLESFESFVRQLVGQAPMSSFAHMLYTLRNAELHEQEERREEQQLSETVAEMHRAQGETKFELTGMPETGRGRLTALFQAMDRDGNGKLDAAEFRDAMKQLGMQNLTGTTVSTIFEAMDIHGAITMEDFLQIVEAEEIYSDTPVSRWLRAKNHGESKFWGHPSASS